LEFIPATTGYEAGYTLNRSLVHHRANIETNNLKPINLKSMLLNYGRKLEYPERTNACWEEHTETPHREAPAEIHSGNVLAEAIVLTTTVTDFLVTSTGDY